MPAPPSSPFATSEEAAIQRVIPIPGGSKHYRADMERKALPIPEGSDICPWCPVPHRLRKHGCYFRRALTREEVHDLLIRRLLCPVQGKTVSLLPDFLLPRKHHTAGVIADFFHAYVLLGLTLLASVARARKAFASYQKGGFWRRCFEKNLPRIRTYLAQLHPEQRREPVPVSARSRIEPALALLLECSRSPRQAFEAHSRRMHRALGCALL